MPSARGHRDVLVVPFSADAEAARRRCDLAAVADELSVVRRAIDLQRTIVDRERQRVSHEVSDRVRPRHRAIVADIAAALRHLSAALEEERELRERLVEADIDFLSTLRPMPFISGTLNDAKSHASLWLRDARDAGLI